MIQANNPLNPVEIAQTAVNVAAGTIANGPVEIDETKDDAVDVDTVVNRTFDSYQAERRGEVASAAVSSSALSESAPAAITSPFISLSASASTSNASTALRPALRNAFNDFKATHEAATFSMESLSNGTMGIPSPTINTLSSPTHTTTSSHSVPTLSVPADSTAIVATSSNSVLLTTTSETTASLTQPQSISQPSVGDGSVTRENLSGTSWHTALFLASIQSVIYFLPDCPDSKKALKSISHREYNSEKIEDVIRELETHFSIKLYPTHTASEVCMPKRDYLLISLWKRYQYYSKQPKLSETPNEQLHLSIVQDLPMLYNLIEQILERAEIKFTPKGSSLENKIIQQIELIPRYALKLISDNRISYEQIEDEATQLASLLSCLKQFNSFQHICDDVENKLNAILHELLDLLIESRNLVANYVSKVALHLSLPTQPSFPLMQKYLASLKASPTAQANDTVLSSSSSTSQLSIQLKPTTTPHSPSWLLNLFFSTPQQLTESKESRSKSPTTHMCIPLPQATSYSMSGLSTAATAPIAHRSQAPQTNTQQRLFLGFLARFIAVYQGNDVASKLDSLISESKTIPSNNSSSISFYLFIKLCFNIGWPENHAKSEQIDPTIISQVVEKVNLLAQEDRTKAAYLKVILFQTSKAVNIVDPKYLNTIQFTAKDKARAIKKEELIEANWNTYKQLVSEIKKKLSPHTQNLCPS